MRHILHRAAVVAALIAAGVSFAAWLFILAHLLAAVPGVVWAVLVSAFVAGSIVATYLDGELFYSQRGRVTL